MRTELVLVVVIVVLLVPIGFSWINHPQPSITFSAVFMLRGEDFLWHSGQLQLTYPDGSSENVRIDGPMQEYASNGTYLGLQSYARANRNFTQSESWRFEYLCPDLNITIGPLMIDTDQPKALYTDSQGRSIEMWFIEL